MPVSASPIRCLIGPRGSLRCVDGSSSVCGENDMGPMVWVSDGRPMFFFYSFFSSDNDNFEYTRKSCIRDLDLSMS